MQAVQDAVQKPKGVPSTVALRVLPSSATHPMHGFHEEDWGRASLLVCFSLRGGKNSSHSPPTGLTFYPTVQLSLLILLSMEAGLNFLRTEGFLLNAQICVLFSREEEEWFEIIIIKCWQQSKVTTTKGPDFCASQEGWREVTPGLVSWPTKLQS